MGKRDGFGIHFFQRVRTGTAAPSLFLGTGMVAFLLVLSACSGPGREVAIQAGSLEIGITKEGMIGSFTDLGSGKDLLPPGIRAPLLTLRVGGRDLEPRSATFTGSDSLLTLGYENGLEARVRIGVRSTHATLELVSVTDSAAVEIAIWGPYPTTIRKVIGETVGVVRGEKFAMGLQSLKPKTLGGYPWKENDAMLQLDIFESGDYSDLSEEGKRHVLYRVEAARPDTFGSTLQAYTRNRQVERIIPNWGHERYTDPSFSDGGIVGSRIALFGCPVDDALSTVGAIEVAEGLPHPMIEGEWGKETRSATAAYVILPFGESTIDEAVDVTLRAGLRYLYHPEPFESWGHFRLGGDFPNGVEGLRDAVERAGARGVRVGVHTLSNFITTNDPYVTPVLDSRLARVGTTLLTEGVSEEDREIGIQNPDFFDQYENNDLRAAVVGQEIVRYRAVSDVSPWKLLDVERGAFGTLPGAHRVGDSIGKLADHAYRVFLTDPELTREMAVTLAELFNQTGLRQISFDGLEGNRSTGLGNYGEILFTTAWYDARMAGVFTPDQKRRMEDVSNEFQLEKVFRYVDQLVATNFPYDITYLRYNIGSDNGPPDPGLAEAVRGWNERYASPTLRISGTTEVFREIESRYGDELPTFREDMTGHWEDGAASSARETALVRRVAEALPQTETLAEIRIDATVTGWLAEAEPSATLFSYMMNNYWETNYRAAQDDEVKFRYSLMAHGPFQKEEAERFGLEHARPLILRGVRR